MKLGFCHLEFWVCSVRLVWYVAKGPSEQEEEEEEQAGRGVGVGLLEREAPITAN